MKRLLQIEFQKLWLNKLNRFLIIVYFLLLTAIALIATLKFDIGPIQFHFVKEGVFDFPYIWHFNTYIASFFKLFLAIIIIAMIANEYSNNTLKQNLIDGLSKKEFIMAKFLMATTLSLLSTIFVFIFSLILGSIYAKEISFALLFSELEFILAYFIKQLGFLSFCICIAILIKRSAFALGFLVLWNFIEWIIYGMLYWNFGIQSKIPDTIMGFFPFRALSNLIKNPFPRMETVQQIANQVGEKINYDYTVHWHELSIVVVLSIIFIKFSYTLLLKRDL